MINRIIMSIGIVAFTFLLLGNYFLKPFDNNFSKACPNDQALIEFQRVIKASTVTENINLTDWNKTAKVSASKFPSGINIHYKFQTQNLEKKEIHKLTMIFSEVGTDGAIAYVYPHSGATMPDSKSTLFTLTPKTMSEISLDVSAPERTGGIAVVTCQNSKKSVISIDLPGYKI